MQIKELKDRISGSEGKILSALGINSTGNEKHQRCPTPDHEDVHPSWRWDQAKAKFFCSCSHGSIYDLVMVIQGLDYVNAVKWCAQVIGIDDSTPVQTRPAPKAPPAIAKPRATFAGSDAERIWNRSLPLMGSVGESYLHARNCALPQFDGDLRCVDDAYHWLAKRKFPALVALITDAKTSQPLSVHLTFLSEDGRTKAHVERPKLMMAGLPIAGGVIRLWPNEDVTNKLVIAEGIETALTAGLAVTPVWACINSAVMQNFPVLKGVESLLIVADADDSGQRAAEATGRRWANAGREVKIWQSEREGADLNDEVTV